MATPSKRKHQAITVKTANVPLAMAEGTQEREECKSCGMFTHCGHWNTSGAPFLLPFIPKGWTRKVLVVVDYLMVPDSRDFRLLRRLMRRTGLDTLDVAIAPALRCRPDTPTRKATLRQIRACRPFLVRTVEVLKPAFIIAMGGVATRALTNDGTAATKEGIKIDMRGRWLPVPGTEFKGRAWCTYDTEDMTQRPLVIPRVIEDFKRVSQDDLAWPLESLPAVSNAVAFDTEFIDGEVLDVALADNLHAGCATDQFELQRGLQDTEYVAGHSVMVDVDSLVRKDLAKPEWVNGSKTIDTLLLARMTDENRGKGGYGVETLLRSKYNLEPWKQKTEAFSASDPREWPVDLRRERCRLDAWGSAILASDFYGSARGPIELTHRTAATLHRLSLAGAVVNLDKFGSLAADLGAEVAQKKDLLVKTAHQFGIQNFEPTNDEQIRELLYDKLKLESTQKTKTGLRAVDQITLKKFAGHEVVDLLVAFNKAEKLYSTNIVGFKTLLQKDWVPFRVNPLGARTGRRASSKPNSQNWSKKIRGIIRSRWEDGLIGDHDYSKLEVILMAWACHDERLLEYFLHGAGYIGVAKELWGTEIEADTDQYKATKGVVLGTQYGMGAYKLALDLWRRVGVRLHSNWERHVEEAKDLRTRYLREFPGIKRYINARKNEVLTTGQVVSPTGRVRHLPCPQKEDTPGFGHLLNEGINFPIQSFASDITGAAMIDVEEALLAEYHIDILDYHKALLEKRWPEMPLLINEVHDDLVYDLHPAHLKRDSEIILTAMKEVPTLRKLVPDFDIELKVGVSINPAWCDSN